MGKLSEKKYHKMVGRNGKALLITDVVHAALNKKVSTEEINPDQGTSIENPDTSVKGSARKKRE